MIHLPSLHICIQILSQEQRRHVCGHPLLFLCNNERYIVYIPDGGTDVLRVGTFSPAYIVVTF